MTHKDCISESGCLYTEVIY